MNLSICSSIVVVGINSNGSLEHPAIVNRVWSDGSHGPAGCVAMVNATVFPDFGTAQSATSLFVFQDKAAGEAWRARGGGTCGYVPAQ